MSDREKVDLHAVLSELERASNEFLALSAAFEATVQASGRLADALTKITEALGAEIEDETTPTQHTERLQ